MKKNYFKTLFYTAFLFLSLCCSTEEPAPAPAPTPPANTEVTASVGELSTTGFKLTFNVAVPGLVATEISIDKEVTITSLTAADDENKIFTVVTSALTAETTYTVTLAKTGYTLSTPLTFTIPKPGDVVVVASASNITTAGFTLTFDNAVEGFATSDMELTPTATIASITASGTENKVFIVAVPLTDNSSYTLKINKKGFSFNPQPYLEIAVARVAKDVTATLSNPTNLGFTLTFDTAITEGLSKEEIQLSPSGTVSSVTAVADSSNKIFNVVTNELTSGTPITVTLSKTYYNLTSQLVFTLPLRSAADLTSLKVGAELFALQVPAAGGTTTLDNAPRTLHTAASSLPVTATVSAGARITVPTSLTSVDFSYGKTVTFTVTAEDGTTVKNYNFIIAEYNVSYNFYGIYTPRHLSDIRNATERTDKFKVMNNIALPAPSTYNNATDPEGMGISDYSTAGWNPIGDPSKYFLGTVDGNKKVISGLSISRSTTNNVGLFGYLNSPSSVIKNLGVTTATSGSVSGNTNVGILAGYSSAKITNCYTKGEVRGATENVGGLIGQIDAENVSGDPVINNCYSTATVVGVNFAGGFIGINKYGYISNCYATGNVSGTKSLGGFIGYFNYDAGYVITVKNCYSTGRVSGPQNIGGFIGEMNANPINVFNCVWDTTTSTQTNSTGGTGKTTAEMKVANPYDDTWTSANWTFAAGQYPKVVGTEGQ